MKKILNALSNILGLGNSEPSAFSPNTEGNQMVIESLIKNGSNLKKTHPLEHHFLCTTQQSFEALMKKGMQLGYRADNAGEGEEDGQVYWYGDLIKDTMVTLKNVNKEDVLMQTLAHEFDADYDGWGTPIIH